MFAAEVRFRAAGDGGYVLSQTASVKEYSGGAEESGVSPGD
jgi:hypothetical protein